MKKSPELNEICCKCQLQVAMQNSKVSEQQRMSVVHSVLWTDAESV